jgi:hypothetical protein
MAMTRQQFQKVATGRRTLGQAALRLVQLGLNQFLKKVL